MTKRKSITEKMVNAGLRVLEDSGLLEYVPTSARLTVGEIYKAMEAARLSPRRSKIRQDRPST